ncbi:MAG: ABC transporter substrate-binding protein [Gammaproteobacteria bacterium]|nr:ABC transporter substrate-binding protein [Gammaproteobacteria bacterium]
MKVLTNRVSRVLKTVATTVTLVVASVGSASAGDLDFGKTGEPVKLVVGYQPYYTEAWSGVVMRGKKFYEKYLPKGSSVEFAVGLQGAVIVNAMLAGKQHIGYVGDMPGIVSTTKQQVADIRIVGALGLGKDQCNIFLTRKDAPAFASPKEALKWLNGKNVAVPKGSCTDRFAQEVFKKENITPGAYLNQNIEVITSGLRAGKLDAAVVWEPTASRLVLEGLAKRVASGASVDENDGSLLTMRADLIKQRPDIVKAWLNAELDAQLYLADPKNSLEIARMAVEQTTGFTEQVLWSSMFLEYPASEGGIKERLLLPFTITPDVEQLISTSATFLHSIKSIHVPKLRPEAVMPEFTQEVLKERGLTAPIGAVQALPASEYKGK